MSTIALEASLDGSLGSEALWHLGRVLLLALDTLDGSHCTCQYLIDTHL